MNIVDSFRRQSAVNAIIWVLHTDSDRERAEVVKPRADRLARHSLDTLNRTLGVLQTRSFRGERHAESNREYVLRVLDGSSHRSFSAFISSVYRLLPEMPLSGKSSAVWGFHGLCQLLEALPCNDGGFVDCTKGQPRQQVDAAHDIAAALYPGCHPVTPAMLRAAATHPDKLDRIVSLIADDAAQDERLEAMLGAHLAVQDGAL